MSARINLINLIRSKGQASIEVAALQTDRIVDGVKNIMETEEPSADGVARMQGLVAIEEFEAIEASEAVMYAVQAVIEESGEEC